MKAGLYSIFALFVSLGRYINNNSLNHSGFRKCAIPVALAGLVLLGAATCGCTGSHSYDGEQPHNFADYGIKVDGDISKELITLKDYNFAQKFNNGNPATYETNFGLVTPNFLLAIGDADGDGQNDDVYLVVQMDMGYMYDMLKKHNMNQDWNVNGHMNLGGVADYPLVTISYPSGVAEIRENSKEDAGCGLVPDERNFVKYMTYEENYDGTIFEGIILNIGKDIRQMTENSKLIFSTANVNSYTGAIDDILLV